MQPTSYSLSQFMEVDEAHFNETTRIAIQVRNIRRTLNWMTTIIVIATITNLAGIIMLAMMMWNMTRMVAIR